MKLFSTSSLLIPKILKIIINPVNIKIRYFLFIDNNPRKEVILESWSFFKDILLFEVKFKSVGSKVNVITKDVIKPNVIIHPKSMIGFISLNIKDKNAKIVVKAVYKIGQNIFLVVKEIISKLFFEGKSFLS